MEKNKTLVDGGSIKSNRHQRRSLATTHRKRKKKFEKDNPNRIVTDDAVIYKDDSFIDKSKKVYSHGMEQVKERLAAMKKRITLPLSVNMKRRKLLTDCMVVNVDGKERELLPDKEPQHKLLVHGCVAREMISQVCMFCRITQSLNEDTGEAIDGSWAIVPAQYSMMNVTTIQRVRKRPFWFLRRYWYEITFDGRVQPAHLLFDYGLEPTAEKTRLWITREYVEVRKQDAENDYFRIWKEKPNKA